MTNHSETLRKQLGEIEAQCDQVLGDIAGIKDQLGRARAKAHSGGVYADSDWFHSASRALRHKQVQHQQLLRAAAEIRRQVKAVRRTDDDPEGRTFERQFMTEAKRFLPETMYGEIIVRTVRAAGPNAPAIERPLPALVSVKRPAGMPLEQLLVTFADFPEAHVVFQVLKQAASSSDGEQA